MSSLRKISSLPFRRSLCSSLKKSNHVSVSVRFASSVGADDGKTHFGYEVVSETEKDKKVHGLFEEVAGKYDLMNDVMSFGVHRCWKDILIDRLAPTPGTRLLDVAGGSGDIAQRFVAATKDFNPPASVTVCDLSQSMMDAGKARDSSGVIKWVQGNAEKLPFEDGAFDALTIVFGLRNVTRQRLALDEAYRVLSPGGRLLIMEFSKVENPVVSTLYDAYSFQVIPVMGQIFAGNFKAYQYLVESIRNFPDQETLKIMIQDAGFWSVTYENLTFGVVSIHSAFKL